MTNKLLRMLEGDDVLPAALHIAQLFNPDMDNTTYHQLIKSWVSECQAGLIDHDSTLNQFKQLQQQFYKVLLFTSSGSKKLDSGLCLMDRVIDYRCGVSVSSAIIFMHIANQLGFKLHGVNFPGHFLLCWQASSQRQYFIDPLDGKFLTFQQVEALYLTITGEEEMEHKQLEAASCQGVIVRLLNNLKAAFLDERKFPQALHCVDLLIQLCPDDPYERRDRGFLLHQLECFNVALADYRHFIRECPKDPAAQLLKLQLRHVDTLPVVLH